MPIHTNSQEEVPYLSLWFASEQSFEIYIYRLIKNSLPACFASMAPGWKFSGANLLTYTEKVNVSLWFQEKTIIPFSGKTGADQVSC